MLETCMCPHALRPSLHDALTSSAAFPAAAGPWRQQPGPPVGAHNGVAAQQGQQQRAVHAQRGAAQRQHPRARLVGQLVCGAQQAGI